MIRDEKYSKKRRQAHILVMGEIGKNIPMAFQTHILFKALGEKDLIEVWESYKSAKGHGYTGPIMTYEPSQKEIDHYIELIRGEINISGFAKKIDIKGTNVYSRLASIGTYLVKKEMK